MWKALSVEKPVERWLCGEWQEVDVQTRLENGECTLPESSSLTFLFLFYALEVSSMKSDLKNN